MCIRVFIMCGVIAAVASIKINDDRVEDLRKRLDDIRNQLHTDDGETRSEQLKEIVSKMSWKDSRKEVDIEEGFLCGMCYLVISELLSMRRVQLQSEANIKRLALEMCVDFEIQSEEVCHGVIELNAPSILFIIDNRPNLTANTVCRMLLNDGDCVNQIDDGSLDFSVQIDSDKSSAALKTPEKVKESIDDLTIIHFSDIHVDFKYMVGAFTDCDEFACCRETDEANETESSAGHWGDYRNCDTPWHAVLDAFHQIRREHSKIDAIYFTGDVVDHFLWDATVVGMKHEITMVFNQMKLVFDGIPVFSVLGNHEAQNIFPPLDINESSLSIQWLYDHVAEIWSERLSTDALESMKSGGYYTTLVRPGLRLIALNNNVCFTFNWWILFEVKSIQKQFQWLHDTLLAAESAGESVHILSHIPSGDEDYHQPCSREYRRIIERFHKTVVAQFTGHTEFFGFNLFNNKQSSESINVAYNSGSLATFAGVNRNYLVHSVDPLSFEVKDFESWIYNLTAANQNEMQNPIWFRQFSLCEAFNLKHLSLSTLSSVVSNLKRNVTAAQQFWRMTIKESDLMLREGCSTACQQQTLCDILITDNNDTAECQRIKKEVEGR